MHPFIEMVQEGGLIAWEEALEALGDSIPLLRKMATTPQDPEWHGEGDVATHTGMVLEALAENLREEGVRLCPSRWLALWCGTLLHDIAKPLTTREREIDGRVRVVAPRHAPRGASVIAYLLPALGIEPRLALDILSLVGLHHEPKRFVKREFSVGRQWMLAESCDVRLLYLLERADMAGRICPDQDEQLEMMELFRMLCEESGGWGQAGLVGRRSVRGLRDPRAGFDALSFRDQLRQTFGGLSLRQHEQLWRESLWDLAEGAISRPEEAVARGYSLVEEMGGGLTIMCGPSGCGKSTWIEKHGRDAVVISLDQMREEVTGDAANQSKNTRVLHLARDRLKEALRHKREIVWDATNLREDSRRMLVRLARDYSVHATLVVFYGSQQDIIQRNRQRERSVPLQVMKRQFASLEWPGMHEAHRTLYVGPEGEPIYDTRDFFEGLDV